DHPDGLAVARALAASGRHALAVYSGPAAGLDILARDGLQPGRVGDVEDALADPAVDAVIVAGAPSKRAAQLRRALQSEHHVFCVHPVDPSPDVGYEAAQLESDVRRVLFPLLPEALHPGIRRLAELAHAARNLDTGELRKTAQRWTASYPRLIESERWSADELLLDGDDPGDKPSLPGWDVLRLVGGEIADVFAVTPPEELAPGEPLLVSGRFVKGGMWRATLLPRQSGA